jgi:hypothetical protein
MLPTTHIGGAEVTRLICGGNPFSGFSHQTDEKDWEMRRYFTMPRLQELLDECWVHGINTVQSRGDRHQMRMILEHRERGGQMQWIAQTASEFRSLEGNIYEISTYDPVAIYVHGSYTDNAWHEGRIEEVHDLVKMIRDRGLSAGVGSHIPEVIEYAEEQGWEADFYMCCFYNLARGYKAAPAEAQNAYANDRFPVEDPARMAAVMRGVPKPCIGFKILAAGRRCDSPQMVRETLEWAYASIKSNDIIDIGMFPKYSNQMAENAGYAAEILGQGAKV